MKRKLLILLGAGSSVEQEFPSTGDLDREMAGWASHYAGTRPAEAIRHDFFALLWKNRNDYTRGLGREQRAIMESRVRPNYERVMGDMHILMNGVLGKPFGDPIHKWLTGAHVFRGLSLVPDRRGPDEHLSNKNFYAVQYQLECLYRRLAERIRGTSCRFGIELDNGRGSARFGRYRALFDRMASRFQLGIYNLNYDTVALSARPKSFVGFNRRSGRFAPDKVWGRKAWDFLYHLHGSVHHRVKWTERTTDHPDFGPKIIWYDDLSQTGDTEDWEDTQHITTRSDGKRMLVTSLIAGGWKLDQLQDDPFLTFYASFARHAHEADAILIGGYGFGDSHVNSILSQALRARTTVGNRPRVAVLDFDEARLPTAKRANDWKEGLKHALRVSPATFRDQTNAAQKHWIELPPVAAGEFEVSSQAPVAVWNNGFLNAGDRAAEIVNWLTASEPPSGSRCPAVA